MNGTPSTAIAPRNGAVATGQPGAALDLHAGQKMWTADQHAALVAMGIPRQATSAELGVFLHQCQRTGLDPFSKQIYLIYRDAYEDGNKVKRPTTQVGIDGFRVIRDRIARRDKLRVEYEETTWYDGEGTACDVWLWSEPPAACKLVVLVDGRRFPAKLTFGEYAQKKRDGSLNKMWSEKPAHMIEKCCEAEGLRKAFPNDLAGVYLEDAMPLPEDTAAGQPPRQRVTAADAQERARHQASQVDGGTGEVVDAVVVGEDPWPGEAQAAAPAQSAQQQQQPADGDPRADVLASLDRLRVAVPADQLAMIGRLTGKQVTTVDALTRVQAQWLADRIAGITTLDELEAAAVASETARASNGE